MALVLGVAAHFDATLLVGRRDCLGDIEAVVVGRIVDDEHLHVDAVLVEDAAHTGGQVPPIAVARNYDINPHVSPVSMRRPSSGPIAVLARRPVASKNAVMTRSWSISVISKSGRMIDRRVRRSVTGNGSCGCPP